MSTHNASSSRSFHPKPPRKQPRRSGKMGLIWLLLGLTGVAISSATAGALLAVSLASTPLLQSRLSPQDAEVFDQGDRISTGLNFRLPQLTRPVNILVLGLKVLSSDLNTPPADAQDLGYHSLVNSFEGLSDTMLLIRFNPSSRELTVLSLPRDTRTYVEGVGLTKLNEANVYGGPALAAKTVSELVGDVGIDRYVRINVQGVEKLVDALGGVSVYVPKDMRYQDDSQHLYINLTQGEHHLNGDQALQFLRFRYDQHGDIGRIQRQQMLMRALMEQALSPATITRIPQILSVIKENVDTNLSVEELAALVGFASQTNRSNVQMLMLPGNFSSPGDFELSYWLPSQRRIDAMADRYFLERVSLVNEEDVSQYIRIAIQDSTEEVGATQRLRDTLSDAGYTNVFADTPWSEPLTTTRIIAQQGNVEAAEAVRRALGVGEVRVESTGNLDSDVTIQLGNDWERQGSASNF